MAVNKLNEIEDPISVSEGAKILGWNYHRFINRVKKGEFKAIKLGWVWLVSKSSVEKFKENQKDS